MPHENIFLDDDTYLKRNPSAQELIQLHKTSDSRWIARFFTSSQSSITQLR